MTIQTIDHSPHAILHRLDTILNELLELRQAVQKMVTNEHPEDLVATLAGSLGPAAPDEMAYFNQVDVTWQRFANEPAGQ